MRIILSKRIYLLVLLVFSVFPTFSQTGERKNVNFPDIPGYKTLKCDFHSHTFLSDGNVSPEFRVKEAWADGLDVIAITDHIDELPKAKFDKKGKTELYQQAYSTAKKSGIILIAGGELTKIKPVGHYNLLFLKSFGSVKRGRYMSVLKRAKKQSAFIVWNHPGWGKKNAKSTWYKVQSRIYQKGLMNGIEIANGRKLYPSAFQWAIEKNLTIFGNSDIHDSTKNSYREMKGEHRPMTLVFAQDTTLQSIKEALTAKRTSVYYKEELYGEEKFLIPLFTSSIEIPNKNIILYQGFSSKTAVIVIINNSCFDYKLKLAVQINDLELPGEITLKANSKNEFIVKVKPDAVVGERDYKCPYNIDNLYKSSNENIQIEIPLHVMII